MSVKIPAVVNGSYINCDNYVAGAQGSFNDVVLRVKLTGDWIIGDSGTKSIVASFVDARGRTASAVIVLPSMAVPGEENTYDIPIPAAAKQYEGDISVVLSGYDQSISEGGYQEFSGDSSTTEFTITAVSPAPDVIFEVALDGIVIAPSEYTYNSENGKVTFRSAPESGDTRKVTYQQHVITQITRTANCFMRVLSSDFVIVDGSELDADLISQINAEIAALNGRVTTVEQEVNEFDADFDAKADKVSAAVAGHFAGLDANGNLTDSGKKASDFLTTADVSAKADKVTTATEGNLAEFDDEGNLADSGVYAGSISEAISRAAEAAVVVKLALMSSESSILASSTSDYNNKLAYATDTHKIYSCYQNAWRDATASMLKEENIYTYGVPNYVYFFDGTQLKEITYLRKISGTTNNFASFSAGGGIQDSGFKGSSFAAASHTHTKSQITDLGLPTPTSADEGKTLKVDGLGRYYLATGNGPFDVTVEVDGMLSGSLYVSYNGITHDIDDTFTIPEGGVLHCYANMSYGDNKVYVDNELVAEGASPGAAEYDYVVTSDIKVTLNGVPNDHGYVMIETIEEE